MIFLKELAIKEGFHLKSLFLDFGSTGKEARERLDSISAVAQPLRMCSFRTDIIHLLFVAIIAFITICYDFSCLHYKLPEGRNHFCLLVLHSVNLR